MNAGNAHFHELAACRAVFCFWAVLAAGDCLFAESPAVEVSASQPGSPTTQPAAESEKTTRVDNLWVDTEIRQVMQDISSQTGIAILCDQTVQGVVTLSVKDMSVEECLERVCSVGGYSYVKVKDYF